MSLVGGTVTLKNIQNICKICLEEKNELIPFDSILELQDTNVASITIAGILAKVIPQVDTTENCHPKVMCHRCLNELTIAYLFVLKYEEADQILKRFFSNPPKEDTDGCEEEKVDFDQKQLFLNLPKEDAEKKLDFDQTEKKPAKSLKKKFKTKTSNEETSTKNILHPCPICTKTFKALELRDHAHTHKVLKRLDISGVYPLKCDDCNTVYLNIPRDRKVRPGTRFSTRRHLESPQETIFKKLDKLHKCPYCDLELGGNEFRVHINAHDGTRNEFRCDKCGRTFKKLRCLNNHRVIHVEEFPYKCETCGKGFVVKTNYDYHILTHTSDKPRLECQYCLRKFTNPRNHHRHVKVHEKVTVSAYKCFYCRNTFMDYDQLKRHVCLPIGHARKPPKKRRKVRKQSSQLRWTLCFVCGKCVLNIRYHMMSHTGEKPFECGNCEKRFRLRSHLNRHLFVHSGLKPYVCCGCGRAFNNLQNLQVHERIHNGVKSHVCPVCNKRFLENRYLTKHMKVHSKL